MSSCTVFFDTLPKVYNPSNDCVKTPTSVRVESSRITLLDSGGNELGNVTFTTSGDRVASVVATGANNVLLLPRTFNNSLRSP